MFKNVVSKTADFIAKNSKAIKIAGAGLAVVGTAAVAAVTLLSKKNTNVVVELDVTEATDDTPDAPSEE